ncbi:MULTISPECIES: hypothetical protein [unclassified Paenibacillus]|uniref:hypothetical protein n=1 Tax=unclassified Paenibacillus TaxID=185978 RepID=UPI002406493B|nr:MULTISPECIES: hypothetical protein [unclassified Paenibacillus]MDF9845134.1 hypothetical protein [Paenibacillus sp. PastF-2]MDF9851733.1 hypothetical protein [Paenibacillus sp. PastM-2]MDF9858314.1 hypothetical protein [Paenibacillus sp. PastF-1]MDH6483606.1 hypothetical protein [Paenibacillus sp. PastH-2]MDH6510989.1 hypothetical protein [Paenibacillus sp. PastM-3]
MKTNVTTKIKDIKFGAKEDVITLTIDGNITDEQVSILRNIKKTGVAFVSFSSSQADLDDYDREEPRKGVSGKIDPDGTAHVDAGQMTLEEAAVAAGDGDEQDSGDAEEDGEDLNDDQDGDDYPGDLDDQNGPPMPDDADDLPL